MTVVHPISRTYTNDKKWNIKMRIAPFNGKCSFYSLHVFFVSLFRYPFIQSLKKTALCFFSSNSVISFTFPSLLWLPLHLMDTFHTLICKKRSVPCTNTEFLHLLLQFITNAQNDQQMPLPFPTIRQHDYSKLLLYFNLSTLFTEPPSAKYVSQWLMLYAEPQT